MAGRPKTRAARRQGLICGAKTRKGAPCQRKWLLGGGKCPNHGGMSTGPRTPEGKARSLIASLKNIAKYNEQRRISKLAALAKGEGVLA